MRVLAFLLVLSAVAARPAAAITVTDAGDNGPGTLRQAIADAANGATIDFALATPATIALATELVIDKNVTITGPGAGALAIDGGLNARAFRVTASAIVTISDLTIKRGLTDDGGGCLYNDGGSVTLSRVVVTLCEASYGGALLNDATDAAALMHVVDSTVHENATSNAAGGGIYNDGTKHVATLVVERSTVSENTASGTSVGGGLINSGFDVGGHAVATIRSSTFSGNSADDGGAVATTGQFNGQSTLRVSNCTFADNTSSAGGAIYVTVFFDDETGSATAEIGNTIFRAGASGGTVDVGSGDSTITSAGFNLASDGAGGDGTTGPGGFLDHPRDRRNTDPLLDVLQANGGATLTYGLLQGSPAIDQGRRDTISTLTDAVDQRGNPRPVDDPTIANATGGDGSDIGAFELQPPRDLAVTALKVPKTVTLKATKPTVTKTLKVTIQNRSAGSEVIPDLATLASVVGVEGTALGAGCAAPVATLVPGKPKLPATIKSKKKLTVSFSATFACAGDPLKTTKKDPGHDDVRWVATVDRTALGSSDEHPDDDVCPRPTLPGGVDPRPNPAKPIKDKGCGGKLPDKTLGADVRTDVVVK